VDNPLPGMGALPPYTHRIPPPSLSYCRFGGYNTLNHGFGGEKFSGNFLGKIGIYWKRL